MFGIKRIGLILTSLLLTACASKPLVYQMPPASQTMIGLEGSKRTEVVRLQGWLTEKGVQFINVGEYQKIVIPARRAFYQQSPRIKQKGYQLLNHIAAYLQHFEKVEVRIVGYPDRSGSSLHNKALSRARAEQVASYLWSQDIDARLLTARSAGLNKLPGYDMKAELEDQQVEVSFRQISHPD